MRIQISLKYHKTNGYYTWRQIYIYDHISFICIHLELEMFRTKSPRENQNTHFTQSNYFESSSVYEIHVEKYCRAGLATDNNIEHAHYMMDT